MNSKKIFLTLVGLSALLLTGCYGSPFSITQWFNSPPKDEKIFSPALCDSASLAWLTPRKILIEEWIAQSQPVPAWRLTHLNLISDSGAFPITIQLKIRSRSRYNSKFDSPAYIVTKEWKKNGAEAFKVWEPILTKISDASMKLELQVEYRHRNYLRPDDKMKTEVAAYFFSHEDLKQITQNSP